MVFVLISIGIRVWGQARADEKRILDRKRNSRDIWHVVSTFMTRFITRACDGGKPNWSVLTARPGGILHFKSSRRIRQLEFFRPARPSILNVEIDIQLMHVWSIHGKVGSRGKNIANIRM